MTTVPRRYAKLAVAAIAVLAMFVFGSLWLASSDELVSRAVEMLTRQSDGTHQGSHGTLTKGHQVTGDKIFENFGLDDDRSLVVGPASGTFNPVNEDLEQIFDPWTLHPPSPVPSKDAKKSKACILVLCRNSELSALLPTLANFESTFNAPKGRRYPYVFLNDAPFDDKFRADVVNEILTARAKYDVGYGPGVIGESEIAEFGMIPQEHWGYPWWINLTIADAWREDMGRAGVIYGGSLSYRHASVLPLTYISWLRQYGPSTMEQMCRYFSGFFFRHHLLQRFEWYWRVEPGVTFYCDLHYDPFEFMAINNKKYGFVITLTEIPETIPSLWPLTLHYAKYKELNSTLLRFFIDDKTVDYNLCHFWSNFEIARLDLWNNDAYIDYFNYLDRWGGFFYERWGDAPVHSLAVGMFLSKDEVHFFDDIGYHHAPLLHCNPSAGPGSKCKCPHNQGSFDFHGSSCLRSWIEYEPISLRPQNTSKHV